MIAQSVLGMFGMFFTIAGHEMVDDGSELRRYLDGPCNSRGTLECCSGSFVSQHPESLGRHDDLFGHSGAGDHFGADTLADTRASPMMRATKQQTGSVPPGCDTVNMLFSPSEFFGSAAGWRQVRHLEWL